MAENDTYYVTYCSKKKEKEGRTIAIRRYKSERIQWVYNKSIAKGVKFAILSGKFGLVKPEKIIPYYNYRMQEKDVKDIIDKNIEFISDNKISKIVYFTENPVCQPDLRHYFKSLHEAIKKLDIKFEVRLMQKKTTYEEVKVDERVKKLDENIVEDLLDKKYYWDCDDAK